jgi:hypothetical protein
MDTIQKTGIDPLECLFSITKKKTGENIWDVEYEVRFVSKAEQSAKTIEPEIDLDDEDEELVLNDMEERIVNTIKKKYPTYATIEASKLAEQFVKVSKTAQSRADRIVEEHLR